MIEAAAQYAQQMDPKKGGDNFCHLLSQLGRRWPASSGQLRWYLGRWLQRVPPTETEVGHKALLQLRAI
jgi:hypothetical protein